jgi:ATP/ADP translocase/HEAT repeat protein
MEIESPASIGGQALMNTSFMPRLLSPVVNLRGGETPTVMLMFVYSFLVMTAYNTVKPSATSKFIADLGADNLPWVMLGAGLLMGFIMQGYSRLVGMIPRRWVLPGTQVLVTGLLLGFWYLFKVDHWLVSAAFYFWGRLLLGIFLISQFWTLANDIYDPRQAKRVFGFIGGGASLGGMTGAGLTSLLAERAGTDNLLLFSAGIIAVCFVIVLLIQKREKPPEVSSAAKSESMGGGEALSLLRRSKHLRLIALVIGFAALGAVTIEQQLNMAAEAEVQTEDAITSFLAGITFYISLAGFFIQVWLVSRIYRIVGIGFALMVLPVSLGATAILILFNPVLWAPSVARVIDSATRYSLDKTTREVLFLPLPRELKLKAKSFVDVTADRFIGKGIGSVLLLIVIKVFGFTWPQISFLSLGYCLIWIYMARSARREYMAVFRRSIETHELTPVEVRRETGDPATIETLIEELGSPEDGRVLYAIDLLESLDKPNLITPLLLHHRSADVRARTLKAIRSVRPSLGERWTPAIEKALKDESTDVRAAAVLALSDLRNERTTELMRPYIEDPDPRMTAAAAVALAASAEDRDHQLAESTLKRMASDGRQSAAPTRREVARAVSQIEDPRFRDLLVPLMYDPDLEVAREAISSAKSLGPSDYIFVPTLVSLLRHRQLKGVARQVLVSYGEGVVDTLAYFLRDEQEDPWVRRHIPGTLALIPGQKSVDILLEALRDDDGFLRYKALGALERLHRGNDQLSIDSQSVEALAGKEALRYFRYLGLHYNLFEKGGLAKDSLLARAFEEKIERIRDRLLRSAALIWPWKDVTTARWAIEKGDARSRSSALEYLDNLMTGGLRKRLMPILDEMPVEEKVRRGNLLLKARAKSVEETLERLIYDEDPVVAALAIDTVRERKFWSLADDLEQALAFRDAKDLVVFEAASHALAEYRLGERGRHAV